MDYTYKFISSIILEVSHDNVPKAMLHKSEAVVF